MNKMLEQQNWSIKFLVSHTRGHVNNSAADIDL